MLIITAPGQGAQTPGFLAPWLELPGVAERLGATSALAGCDLVRFGPTASADEIEDTAVAAPLRGAGPGRGASGPPRASRARVAAAGRAVRTAPARARR